ncbi:hypothetical protein PAHA111176_08175 [Parendozoicomonas haliclonae]|uniref:Uncharacterized protein n=2 Tax=Parendozoicomonas haliclonae TaxID=1960125 RepID=A0A1X7AE72_9GAMM|nr:hypothetical protein EHSB41UT_00296 [Parendozoicomonas haliclonae]
MLVIFDDAGDTRAFHFVNLPGLPTNDVWVYVPTGASLEDRVKDYLLTHNLAYTVEHITTIRGYQKGKDCEVGITIND